jgi:hypothetical protein
MAVLLDAFAQFYEDIRFELSGQQTLVGLYPGTYVVDPNNELSEGSEPFLSKLAIMLTIIWSEGTDNIIPILKYEFFNGEHKEVTLLWPPPDNTWNPVGSRNFSSLNLVFRKVIIPNRSEMTIRLLLGERTIDIGKMRILHINSHNDHLEQDILEEKPQASLKRNKRSKRYSMI